MEKTVILLDTNVLIDTLRQKPRAMERLRNLALGGAILTISTVSVAELFAGMKIEELAATEQLLANVECIPVTFEIARKAGEIRATQRRLGRTFTLDDMMVAATAILVGCPLLTANRKDFEISEIELLPY